MDQLATLLEAVYADLDDDQARLIYADALIERGDPRGELIALQVSPSATPIAAKQRADELIAQHGAHLLGEIAPFVTQFTFERGFLATCTVDRELVRANAGWLVGNPVWSTVRDFAGSEAIALHPNMRSLRALTFDARSEASGDTAWVDLLVGTERRWIEELRYVSANRERTERVREASLLRGCSALPNLERLELDAQHLATDFAFVVGEWVSPLLGPLAPELDSIVFKLPPYLRDGAVHALVVAFGQAYQEAPVPVLGVRFNGRDGTYGDARFERRDLVYERVIVNTTTDRADVIEPLTTLFRELPFHLRRAQIHARPRLDDARIAALRANHAFETFEVT